MNTNTSVLEGLYTDSGGFDRERVATALKAVLTIQRGEHTVFFNKEVNLKAEDKILAYALVKKLLKTESVVDVSSVSGKELKKQTDVKAGTVDATIKKLKEVDGLLVGSGSSYEIPAHKVETVIERLEKCALTKNK
jgi:hypothetical protein